MSGPVPAAVAVRRILQRNLYNSLTAPQVRELAGRCNGDTVNQHFKLVLAKARKSGSSP
jgi:hypothetical protein